MRMKTIPSLGASTDQRLSILLLLLPLGPTNLLTQLDRIRPRRFKDGIDLLERQLARLGEDEIRGHELEGIVHDVHNPDLISDLGNTHADPVRLDHTRGALDHVVKTHALGT